MIALVLSDPKMNCFDTFCDFCSYHQVVSLYHHFEAHRTYIKTTSSLFEGKHLDANQSSISNPQFVLQNLIIFGHVLTTGILPNEANCVVLLIMRQ